MSERRNSRRKTYVKKEKETHRLVNRLDNLWKAERGSPRVKLDKPIRSGWKRYFVLRDDLRWRSDAKKLEAILEKLNTIIYCNRKDFLIKNYMTKKMIPIEQELKHLERYEYEDLPDLEKKLFSHKVIFRKNWRTNKLEESNEWHYNSPDIFVLKIRPHYITEVPALYPDIESERDKIYHKLYRQGDYWKYCYEKGHSKELDYTGVRRRLREKLLDKEMKESIE